jgi:hypothetical protein
MLGKKALTSTTAWKGGFLEVQIYIYIFNSIGLFGNFFGYLPGSKYI